MPGMTVESQTSETLQPELRANIMPGTLGGMSVPRYEHAATSAPQ